MTKLRVNFTPFIAKLWVNLTPFMIELRVLVLSFPYLTDNSNFAWRNKQLLVLVAMYMKGCIKYFKTFISHFIANFHHFGYITIILIF